MERNMSGGGQDARRYLKMLKYNLSKKSRYDNNHAQQTPSSTYFLNDDLIRDGGVLLNLRQRVKLIKNPDYLRRSGVPLKEITPATILFPLKTVEGGIYY